MAKRNVINKSIINIILTLGGILVIIPIYLTIINSFKSTSQIMSNFFALPPSFNLDNFKEVLQRNNFFLYVFNSVEITLVQIITVATIIPMASYAIYRNMNQKKYYKFLYYFIVAGIFVPFQVIMLPQVKMMDQLGLLNKSGLMILNTMFSLLEGIFLFVAYSHSIPHEIEEAAFIDGCSVWNMFVRIIYPLMKPITATYVIIRGLHSWNDFLLPLLMLNKSNTYWTLPLFQYNFKGEYAFDYNLLFASIIMSVIPIMIFYAFGQKYIISGLTNGAVKG